jgi:glycosyltransferase involved in cell wall biosynthesis
MSNALVEAFACGTAVVATDIAANREICDDGVNSILVPVGEAPKLARAVTDIFNSPELANTLGAEARRKAENELSIEKMVLAYLETYEEVLLSAAK